MASANKITPFLWFDDNAEEAVNHYKRAMEAMMQMSKLDIATLQRAYEEK